MENVSPQAQYTLNFINQTQKDLFLTGKAGTGKTTLLKEIIKTTHKKVVVVAPTGIAALNAGGVTMHSMFQLPLSGFIPDFSQPNVSSFLKFESKSTLGRHFKMSGAKKAILRNLELLIIDEVSMLRPDLLDAIDFLLQSIRRKKIPFGGVQVLFIGDLLQLPPIIRDEEWQVLKQYYVGKFFFHSQVILQNPPLYIELEKIFRQADPLFIDILNNLRLNTITQNDTQVLNQYYKPNFEAKAEVGLITLTTHNAKADSINQQALQEINQPVFKYNAEIIGDFPDKIYPLEPVLELKLGSQVMFVKNDLSFEKRYFNGKMGTISSISKDEIWVQFADDHTTIQVDKYEWQNIKYSLNADTKEIDEEVIGTFVHFPIKLAWAITVHKSQGLTFAKAALDVSQVFQPGQAYVALSRLQSLQGLTLLSPMQLNGIQNDAQVLQYAQNKASEDDLKNQFSLEKQRYIFEYFKNAFDWDELAQKWRNFHFDFVNNTDINAKIELGNWSKKCLFTIEELQIPSNKFINQLEKLCLHENADFDFILNRINAAYDYFYTKLDELVFDLLYKLEEVIRIKKAKIVHDDLVLLEEMQTNCVLQLMKAQLLAINIVLEKPFNKESLQNLQIKEYRVQKINNVREIFKQKQPQLVEEEVINKYVKKEKKEKLPKLPKKSTYELTFELWQQNLSFQEIAEQRVLSPQTIEGHMSKLIDQEKVSIFDLLPKERIAEIAEYFIDYSEETLSPLKEKLGEKATWNELKWYKSYINLTNTQPTMPE